MHQLNPLLPCGIQAYYYVESTQILFHNHRMWLRRWCRIYFDCLFCFAANINGLFVTKSNHVVACVVIYTSLISFISSLHLLCLFLWLSSWLWFLLALLLSFHVMVSFSLPVIQGSKTVLSRARLVLLTRRLFGQRGRRGTILTNRLLKALTSLY